MVSVASAFNLALALFFIIQLASAATQCTGEWSEWSNAPGASCNDTCGNCGLVKQQRTCLPAGCKCTGASTAVNPCGNPVCIYPRESCCAPYKKAIVNGGFVCK